MSVHQSGHDGHGHDDEADRDSDREDVAGYLDGAGPVRAVQAERARRALEAVVDVQPQRDHRRDVDDVLPPVREVLDDVGVGPRLVVAVDGDAGAEVQQAPDDEQPERDATPAHVPSRRRGLEALTPGVPDRTGAEVPPGQLHGRDDVQQHDDEQEGALDPQEPGALEHRRADRAQPVRVVVELLGSEEDLEVAEHVQEQPQDHDHAGDGDDHLFPDRAAPQGADTGQVRWCELDACHDTTVIEPWSSPRAALRSWVARPSPIDLLKGRRARRCGVDGMADVSSRISQISAQLAALSAGTSPAKTASGTSPATGTTGTTGSSTTADGTGSSSPFGSVLADAMNNQLSTIAAVTDDTTLDSATSSLGSSTPGAATDPSASAALVAARMA